MLRKILIISTVFAAAIGIGSIAALPSPLLGSITRVTAPNLLPEMLTWAYAHPSDKRRLMVCGMAETKNEGNANVGYVYTSDDAGITWQERFIDRSGTWVSETNCTYGVGTNVYFYDSVSDYNTNGGDYTRSHGQLYASKDAGKTWQRVLTSDWFDWVSLTVVPFIRQKLSGVVLFANGYALFSRYGTSFRSTVPAVAEVTNGGHTLSKVIPFNWVDGRREYSFFSGGSTILADGTALFAGGGNYGFGTHPESTQKHSDVQLFEFSPYRKTVRLRAMIATYPYFEGHGPFLASISQDQSRGRFHGRLYVAWVLGFLHDGKNNASSLHLATSDDRGRHWSSRLLLSNTRIWSGSLCQRQSIFDQVRVAVNRDGVVGILWVENRRDLLFASSNDGGQTFTHSSIIARNADSPQIKPAFLLGMNNYAGAIMIAEETGDIKTQNTVTQEVQQHEPGKLVPPGLEVEMVPEALSNAPEEALIADGAGKFHAFWAADGDPLTTRSIDASTPAVGGVRTLSDPTPPTSRMCVITRLHPALPMSASIIATPSGWRDITSAVVIDPLHYNYEFTTHTFRIDAALVSKNKQGLGRLALVATDLHSDFGTPIALNAVETMSGYPVWRLEPSRRNIQANTYRQVIDFAFQINSFHALSPYAYIGEQGDGVAMKFHVFEEVAQP